MANIAFPSISTSTKLPSGTTYSYVHVEPKDNKPYILLLHGWPETSFDWKSQIEYFSKLGYGLVVPDLLGYGGTDKPSDLQAYNHKKMAEDIIALLDKLSIKDVIGVAHDWGCVFLSRFVNYHPTRFTKYAFLTIAYNPPRGPFSTKVINEATEKGLGYPIFSYWDFFNEQDAADLLDKHPESTKSLKYAASGEFQKENMCYPNATRSYYEAGKTGPIASWATADILSTHDKSFATSNGGYGPSLNWYKSMIAQVNAQDESSIPEEAKHITKPALLITSKADPIALPKMQEDGTREFAKDLTVKEIDAGHWVQWEKADEVNETLASFITA